MATKRQLTDVSEAVRAVPAPELPEFGAPFGLRFVDPDSDDPALIATWMKQPHLVETWEQPWSVDEWRADSLDRLGDSYSRPCILSYEFEDGRRDIGYVELYRVAQDENALLYDADPWDMGFHVATADLDLIGRGVMSQWMASLVAEIWRMEPQCRRIIVDPDYRNVRMRRAVEKKRFCNLGEYDVRPDRRIALYAIPRTPADLPHVRPDADWHKRT